MKLSRLPLQLIMAAFAFDIETTGLDPSTGSVTCVCACGEDLERCWLPGKGEALEEFFEMMDRAPFLVAFNGCRFDLNYLQVCYGLSAGRVGAWVLKLRDAYEASRLAFGRGFSLNQFLDANGLGAKTSTGCEAVAMAREGRWDELREYCMADARLAWQVTKPGVFLLPFLGVRLDIVKWDLASA